MTPECKPSDERNGCFLDKSWSCKVCDGEIPSGHTGSCDIWKLEQKVARLHTALVFIGKAFELKGDQTDCGMTYRDAISGVETEWLPIDSAPKDGRTLLLGYFNSAGNWRTMRGQWFAEGSMDEWDGGYDANPEGWYETVVEADDPPNCWATEPAYWRALPAPPLRAQVGQGTNEGGPREGLNLPSRTP